MNKNKKYYFTKNQTKFIEKALRFAFVHCCERYNKHTDELKTNQLPGTSYLEDLTTITKLVNKINNMLLK